MPCVLTATLAELLELEPSGGRLLVLGGRVVPLFAIAALSSYDFSHGPLPELRNFVIW